MIQTQDDMRMPSSDSELKLSSGIQVNTIPKQQSLVISDDSNVNIKAKYHLSEIEQNGIIIGTAKKIIWSGFLVIAVGIILAYKGNVTVAIITTAAGVITEFISAIIFAFVTMSNKSKLKYFEQLTISEEGDKYMEMISQLEDKKAKEKLMDKMISNYCERRKEH